MTVRARGAAGGSAILANATPPTDPTNGAGADITATYQVVAGQSYSGNVGTGGGASALATAPPGGQPGGGDGGLTNASTRHNGAGGGGYTDVAIGGLDVVVAGGGGGSGGGHNTVAGRGGDAGIPTGTGVTPGTRGTNGYDSPTTVTSNGGGGGGATAAGAGGTHSTDPGRSGVSGSGRNGGRGANDDTPDAGGGGGGGYYGGGGGASTLTQGSGAATPTGIGGAGGGGGSSYVRPISPDGTGVAATDVTGARGPRLNGGNPTPGTDGLVTLTWVTCDYDLGVTKTVSPNPAEVGQSVTWTISVTNNGPDPMTQGDTVTLTDSLPGSGTKTITAINDSGGGNDRGLARGAVTCDAAVGAAMPASLTCSRPYAPSAPTAPSTGVRGLDNGETLTVVYRQTVTAADVGNLDNTATVTDRGATANNATTHRLVVAQPQPTSAPDTSTGTQGAPQSVNPLANDTPGSATAPLVPSTLTLVTAGGTPTTQPVTVAGQGTYTIDRTDPANPRIVFTPLPGFSGTADPVGYRVADSNGSTTTSTYTPTVTVVARPDAATGPQGVPLTIDVLANDGASGVTLVPSTLTLVGTNGQPATTVTVTGGVYSVANGRVVFTPDAGFTGTAPPAIYQVSDSSGNPIRSTVTPTITAVSPAATPDTSTGPQGAPQSVAPLANDSSGNPGVTIDPTSLTLLNADGTVATGDVAVFGQGTYSIDRTDAANPRIVFTPLPAYSGTPTPVGYRFANANGTTARSTYAPTVTDVTRPDTSTGVQGATQTTNVLANDNLSTPGGGALDPTTLQLRDPADGVFKDTVVVGGVGTYATDDAGNVVFTPLRTYTGTPPALPYAVSDQQGNRLTDTYTPTVTPVTPVANPDASTGAQGVAQRVNPLTNDTPGNAAVPLVPSSLTLLTAGGTPTDTLVVAGQGTYTVDRTDPANPLLVFTPLATYTGSPTPATYRVADANGTTASSTYAPRVVPVAPTAVRDTSTGPQGDRQTVDPFANDTAGNASVPIDRTSLTLLTAGGTPTDTLTVAGQGTYTVDRTDPANPRLTFQPLPGYTGSPTAATYRIADVNGTTARATYAPTVTPVTTPDTSTGIQGANQSVNVLANDNRSTPGGGGFDPTTLQLVDPADGTAKDAVTVPGVGVYTVDDAGNVTFDPAQDYVGTPAPLTYRVRDLAGGLLSSTYTPTVTPVTPVAEPDASAGPQGVAQRVNPLANDRPGNAAVPLDPTTLTLLDGTTAVDTLTVPGQGVYTIDRTNPTNPQIVFTPNSTFYGSATPAPYRVADANGTTAGSTYTPSVARVTPTGKPDFTTSTQGNLQSVDPYADNGAGPDVPGDPAVPIVRSSLRLLDADGNPIASDRLVVAGQGTYTVDRTDPNNPRITFQPLPAYVGTPTPVTYKFSDVNLTLSDPVTYNPTVLPVTTPDTTRGVQGVNQTVDLLANDTLNTPAGGGLDPTTLQLVDPADGTAKDSVTVAGVGTYAVDDAGNVVFDPEPSYVGTPPALPYVVRDLAGNLLRSTYTPTVTAVTPTASPDTTSGPQGVPQRVDPLANDRAGDPQVPLDPASLTLLNAGGTPVTSLTTPNEGTYTVDRTDPARPLLVFTPLPGFTGEATPADYRVADVNGTKASSSYTPTLDPVRPVANPDATTGPQGARQRVSPLGNDAAGDPAVALDPASLTLLNGAGTPVTSLTIPDQGTYTVDRTDSANPQLVFTPLPTFVGLATPADYRVADANGTTTRSTYTPTVTDVTQPDTSTGVQGRPQTVNVLANDTLSTPGGGGFDQTTLQLVDPADGVAKDSVTRPGVGTYTVDDAGNVTFQPLPTYVGTPSALTYTVRDRSGGTLTDTYTPTVTAVTPVASPDTTSGPQGVAQQVDPLANDRAGDVAVPLDPASLTLLDAAGDPVTTLAIPDQGTYTVDRTEPANPLLVFTPLPTFVGVATPADYRVADVNGTQTRSTYTPTLERVTPVAAPDTTSGPQGALQRVDPFDNDTPGDPLVPIDRTSLTLLNAAGTPVTTLVVPDQGTYRVDRTDPANPILTFQPLPGFTGPATPAAYRIADANGTTARSTYTPTVGPVTRPDPSTDVQGVPQVVDVLANDNLTTPGGGGFDPTTLQLIDPADGVAKDTVTVPGVGTYVVDDAGHVTFTPLPTFVGTADPVTYVVDDRSGGRLSSTYTPTVTAIAPTANPDTTSGPQGVPQRIDPLANDTPGDPRVPLDRSSLTLLDSAGDPVASVTVAGGVYTVANGQIVFTPDRAFIGTPDPVTYRVADVNGTPTTSTYTPTFLAVVPVANPDMTSGSQGARQSVDPFADDVAGSSSVPLDRTSLTLIDANGDAVTALTVPGVGTYSVSGATIRFQPLPAYSGTPDPVTYRIADANGTFATSTYTPTVTPVTRPDTSSDVQGVRQTADVLANDTLTPGVTLDPKTLVLVDPVTGATTNTVTFPNQGTYTVVDGEVRFQPVPQFTGVATPITYQVDDTAGNTVGSTYTPTVTPLAIGPNPDVTSGPQGRPQSVDPLLNDRPGDPRVPLDPSTLTLLDADGNPTQGPIVIPDQGTYALVDGRIVFTPLPTFVGTATPVGYSVADRNGTREASAYTPTVTPVAPDPAPDTTHGVQGRPQSIDPLTNDRPGNPDVPLDPSTLTLLDANGEETGDPVVIPGQGTYRLVNGKIIFTPLPGFIGTATPVGYRIADVNGTTATSSYTPTLVPVAPTAEPDRSRGPLNKAQSVDPLANDSAGDPAVPLNPSSLTLIDTKGDPAISVTVPGQGTYTIVGGRIVFTPVRGFIGTADPVGYRVADVNGTTTTSTYTPTIEAGVVVTDVSKAGPQGSTVTLNPLKDNPAIDPGTIRLIGPDGTEVTRLVVPGEGTWVVDTGSGTITFTPERGFDGNPTPVDYVAFETDGTPVTGTLTITYDKPSTSPGRPNLASTGAQAGLVAAGLAGLGLLGGGLTLVVLAAGRRRRT